MDFLLEALTNWLKEMLVGGIMSNLSGTVSYTHLDVYKRQTSGRTLRFNFSPSWREVADINSAGCNQAGESQRQVQRFIRLTELIPELLDMVDEKKIALKMCIRDRISTTRTTASVLTAR